MEQGNVGNFLSLGELEAAKVRFAVYGTYPRMSDGQKSELVGKIFSPMIVTICIKKWVAACVEFDNKSGTLILKNSVQARKYLDMVL